MLATRCLLHSFIPEITSIPRLCDTYIEMTAGSIQLKSQWTKGRSIREFQAQDVAAPNGRTKIHVSSTKGPLRTSYEFSYMFTCPFARSPNCVVRGSRTEKLGKKPLEIKHTFNAADLYTHGTVQLRSERVKIMFHFLQSRNAMHTSAFIPDEDHSNNKDCWSLNTFCSV